MKTNLPVSNPPTGWEVAEACAELILISAGVVFLFISLCAF